MSRCGEAGVRSLKPASRPQFSGAAGGVRLLTTYSEASAGVTPPPSNALTALRLNSLLLAGPVFITLSYGLNCSASENSAC